MCNCSVASCGEEVEKEENMQFTILSKKGSKIQVSSFELCLEIISKYKNLLIILLAACIDTVLNS